MPLSATQTWLTRLATPPAPVTAPRRCSFTLSYEFGIDHDSDMAGRQVMPISYRYVLLDANGSEILAYHWHPIGMSPVVTPHLHVSARHGDLDLLPAHLPTGQVSPISFIRALITEFGAEPSRADWDQILGTE